MRGFNMAALLMFVQLVGETAKKMTYINHQMEPPSGENESLSLPPQSYPFPRPAQVAALRLLA